MTGPCRDWPLLRPALHDITVLDRPAWLFLQNLLCFDGPIRFSEQFARKKDEVRLSARDDVIGVLWIANQPDRPGSNSDLVTDAPGKGHLVTFGDRNLRVVRGSAGGDINQVYTKLLELLAEDNRLLDIPASLDPIGS